MKYAHGSEAVCVEAMVKVKKCVFVQLMVAAKLPDDGDDGWFQQANNMILYTNCHAPSPPHGVDKKDRDVL
jgi:hypothetical protein